MTITPVEQFRAFGLKPKDRGRKVRFSFNKMRPAGPEK
jgi:hypothetical protein